MQRRCRRRMRDQGLVDASLLYIPPAHTAVCIRAIYAGGACVVAVATRLACMGGPERAVNNKLVHGAAAGLADIVDVCARVGPVVRDLTLAQRPCEQPWTRRRDIFAGGGCRRRETAELDIGEGLEGLVFRHKLERRSCAEARSCLGLNIRDDDRLVPRG